MKLWFQWESERSIVQWIFQRDSVNVTDLTTEEDLAAAPSRFSLLGRRKVQMGCPQGGRGRWRCGVVWGQAVFRGHFTLSSLHARACDSRFLLLCPLAAPHPPPPSLLLTLCAVIIHCFISECLPLSVHSAFMSLSLCISESSQLGPRFLQFPLLVLFCFSFHVGAGAEPSVLPSSLSLVPLFSLHLPVALSLLCLSVQQVAIRSDLNVLNPW